MYIQNVCICACISYLTKDGTSLFLKGIDEEDVWIRCPVALERESVGELKQVHVHVHAQWYTV